MDKMEIFEKGEEIVLKELDQLFAKGSLSPAETEAAKNGLCLLKEMEELMEGSDEGYSERRGRGGSRSSRRSYEGRAYEGGSYGGQSYYMDDRMPFREYGIVSYEGGGGGGGGSSRRGGMSNASRGGGGGQSREGRGRYSSHSINDRVVEKLENLMDTAESDYERQKIHEFIRFVRDDEMNM